MNVIQLDKLAHLFKSPEALAEFSIALENKSHPMFVIIHGDRALAYGISPQDLKDAVQGAVARQRERLGDLDR